MRVSISCVVGQEAVQDRRLGRPRVSCVGTKKRKKSFYRFQPPPPPFLSSKHYIYIPSASIISIFSLSLLPPLPAAAKVNLISTSRYNENPVIFPLYSRKK